MLKDFKYLQILVNMFLNDKIIIILLFTLGPKESILKIHSMVKRRVKTRLK